MIKKIIFLCVLLVFTCFLTKQASADWQSDLENQFDIVSTFDELEDWHGIRAGGNVNYETSHPEDMPQLKTGGKGIWGMYSQYYSGPNQVKEEWIGNHNGEVWSGTKSAAINYASLYCDSKDHDTEKGYGPGRLGLYIGDGTPTSGYRKINVFFMMKFPDGFWALTDSENWSDQNIREYKYPPVIKMFDCVTGFDEIDNYHHRYVYPVPGPEDTCNGIIGHEYGTNFSIFNTSGGGLSRPPYLYFLDGGAITDYDTCWKYAHKETNQSMYPGTNFQQQYENNEWFGVEYELNLGTVDESDGSTEFWVYDNIGQEVGHYLNSDMLMQTHLSYNYNKLVFGGNYQCAGGTDTPGITHWYFDDLVIDDQRIGPTYFDLLNNNVCDVEHPSLCASEVDCLSIGANWCEDSVCQSDTCLIRVVRADVDQNSIISTTDAMLTLRNSLGLDMSESAWVVTDTTGDVNCDDSLNLIDAMLLLRYSLELDMDKTDWCE